MSHKSHVMRQTSIEAFDKIKHIGRKQREVLGVIKRATERQEFLTDREIARELGFKDPNKVRPRRHELMKLELIQAEGTKTCSVTGKTAITWRIPYFRRN